MNTAAVAAIISNKANFLTVTNYTGDFLEICFSSAFLYNPHRRVISSLLYVFIINIHFATHIITPTFKDCQVFFILKFIFYQ